MQLTQTSLIGVWQLQQFIIERESGEQFIWPGKQNGTLIYTDSGYVSVAQNRQPLTNPSAEDQLR
ncbi:lipocalin-like domain-containing protein [Shewanella marina]|uniref:lipocalin-like domain-containing protein n=1 Tax=Shewanella marina TaxID=487319 RepID=UPI000B28FF2D|nr:lipocalin-like domain-containing protein [Shewanella marina]